MEVSREQVLNRIREAGFSFKRQTDKVDLYKKSGSTSRLSLPRCKVFQELDVRVVLRQAGLSDVDIEDFMDQAIKC